MRKSRADGGQQTAPEGGEYVPMEFSAECELTLEEQQTIETQRKDLWNHGIRKQPQLDRMAFEFAYVICVRREAAR